MSADRNASVHATPSVARFLRWVISTRFTPTHDDRPARLGSARRVMGERPMDLFVWLPAMFFLGLASMGLFVAFVAACERI